MFDLNPGLNSRNGRVGPNPSKLDSFADFDIQICRYSRHGICVLEGILQQSYGPMYPQCRQKAHLREYPLLETVNNHIDEVMIGCSTSSDPSIKRLQS